MRPIIFCQAWSFAAASQGYGGARGAAALNNLVGDKPLLGICVGMQLFARSGAEHGVNPGLVGWMARWVYCLCHYRCPMWAGTILPRQRLPIIFNMPAQPCFYFTHSFAFTQVPVQRRRPIAPMAILLWRRCRPEGGMPCNFTQKKPAIRAFVVA